MSLSLNKIKCSITSKIVKFRPGLCMPKTSCELAVLVCKQTSLYNTRLSCHKPTFDSAGSSESFSFLEKNVDLLLVLKTHICIQLYIVL